MQILHNRVFMNKTLKNEGESFSIKNIIPIVYCVVVDKTDRYHQSDFTLTWADSEEKKRCFFKSGKTDMPLR